MSQPRELGHSFANDTGFLSPPRRRGHWKMHVWKIAISHFGVPCHVPHSGRRNPKATIPTGRDCIDLQALWPKS